MISKISSLFVASMVICGCSMTNAQKQFSYVELWSEDSSITITAYYGEPMPEVTPPVHPYPNYEFMGYFDKLKGKGNQYYNSDGSSARNWDKTDNYVNLYAYYVKQTSNSDGDSSSGQNEQHSNYYGNDIKNISTFDFEVTYFGSNAFYFVCGLSLNNNYISQNNIMVTVNVKVPLIYQPLTSGYSSYTIDETKEVSMNIGNGEKSCTGSGSISWPETVTHPSGNQTITYRISPTYEYHQSYSISGLAIYNS